MTLTRLAASLSLGLALTLALAACAARSGPQPQDGSATLAPSATQLPAGLAGLPRPSELSRTAAAVDSVLLAGDAFSDSLPLSNTARDGGNAIFTPSYSVGGPVDGMAYATWAFDVSEYSGTASIGIGWNGAAPGAGETFVAVADYSRNAWVWSAADSGTAGFGEDIAPLLNGGTSLLVIVAVAGQTEHQLERVALGRQWVKTPLLPVDTDFLLNYPADLLYFDGRPWVISADQDSGSGRQLLLLRANDADGLGWAAAQELNSNADIMYCGLGVIDGALAAAYQDRSDAEDEGDLILQRAADATGAEWGAPATIDTSNAAGGFPVIVDMPGDAHGIAYVMDDGIEQVFFASTTDGVEWSSAFVGITGAGNLSAMLVDGHPAISWQYVNGSEFDLHYSRSEDAFGAVWPGPVWVDASGSRDAYDNSMQIINGVPCILYDEAEERVSLVRASDAQGAAWGSPVPVFDNAPDSIAGPALGIIDGLPCFTAIYNPDGSIVLDDGSGLAFWQGDDANGLSFTEQGAFVQTMLAEQVFLNSLLREVNGKPAVLFVDHITGQLTYAVYL